MNATADSATAGVGAQQRSGTTRLRVRYAETDQMGVVYHANYLVWCEIGRTELMRQLGFPYADLERAGIRLAVADAQIRYGRAARYDDDVAVHTRLVAVRSRTLEFEYRIARESDDALLATASTRLIAIDDAGATRRLPDELIERFRHAAD